MLKKNLLIFLLLFCGCAKLANLQELLTLKDYSDAGEQTDKYIEKQNKCFESLITAVSDNSIKQFMTKRAVVKKFGPPILREPAVVNNQDAERWLYRYPVKFMNSDKVYLYFDVKDDLVEWKYEQAVAESKVSSQPVASQNVTCPLP